MAHIAKIALSHGGRFIKIGEKVPPDYPRLAEGIKRGWIEVTGDPAATPSPVKKSAASLPPVVGDPMAEQLATTGDEVIAPEEPPEYVEPSIEDIDHLNPMAQESLKEKGVVYIRDLDGWDVEALDELRGIGVKLAERLISEFAKWKASFSEYTEAPIGTEIDVLPLEDGHAESKAGESDEDEGSEND